MMLSVVVLVVRFMLYFEQLVFRVFDLSKMLSGTENNQCEEKEISMTMIKMMEAKIKEKKKTKRNTISRNEYDNMDVQH